MATFVMLTRVAPEALKSLEDIKRLEKAVQRRIQRECPGVVWNANFAILGPYDYLDIFEAADEAVAAKLAMIVRSSGHAQTETWTALTWDRYKKLISVDRTPEACARRKPQAEEMSWTSNRT